MTTKAKTLWTDAEIEEVRAMLLQGISHHEIGVKFGRSAMAINSLRKKHRLLIMGVRPAYWTKDEIDVLGEMIRDGMTDAAISKIMNRSSDSIFAKRKECFSDWRPVQRPAVIGRPISASVVMSKRPLAPEEASYTKRAYATTAFLIELLRAGHKPGQGEFHIPSECRVVRPSQLVGA